MATAPQSHRRAQLAVVAVIGLTLVGVVLRRVLPPPKRARPIPPTPLVPTAGKLPPQLADVGPRLVSNQTETPLLFFGRDLKAGDVLDLGPPANLKITLADSDGVRGWAKLPVIDLPAAQSEAEVTVTLEGGAGAAHLTVVNDRHFPDPVGLAAVNGTVCAISTTTDEMRCAKAEGLPGGLPVTVALGDGPTAIAAYGSGGSGGFIIGYEFLSELWLVSPGNTNGEARKIPGPRNVSGIAVGDGVAYVAEHQHNQLWAIDLKTGAIRWQTNLDPGPGRVAIAGGLIAVGSRQTGEVQLVDRKDGTLTASISPSPGMPIFGGHTEKLSKRIDGGLCVRDLIYSPKLSLLFVASSGPNIGPNPERVEVAMNGGVTVIDLARRSAVFHLGFGSGVTESLALDDAHGLLYASDVATGLVRVIDAKKLSRLPKATPDAMRAVVSTLAIPPPDGFPLIRPKEDFDTHNRSGIELHSGPKALALDGATLYALNRLTGTLAPMAVQSRGLVLQTQVTLFDPLTQPKRRTGEVVYYTDLGRTGMSCDACHIDGHVGGLLFSKTKPMRIYRSTSLRGARETPPYFIPPSEKTLMTTAAFVGSRNRYQNPEMSEGEVETLSLFTSEIPTPPNPFMTAEGAPPPALTLPDGAVGHPKAGAAVFFGKAACQVCHPGPLFTTDQNQLTRGRLMDVGTPDHFPLHPELQDGISRDFPAQSLNGIWDLFPLTTTGFAGFQVQAQMNDDEKLAVGSRFPLRTLIEYRGTAPHGKTGALTPAEKNDLLAFLMTL